MKLGTAKDRDRWLAFVQGQPLPLEVSCEPWHATRSNQQNAYLWRAIYQPLVEVAGFNKDLWHEKMCGDYFGWVDFVKPGGVIEQRPARTTTTGLDGKRDVLKGPDFTKFVRFVESELSGMGVFVSEQWEPGE